MNNQKTEEEKKRFERWKTISQDRGEMREALGYFMIEFNSLDEGLYFLASWLIDPGNGEVGDIIVGSIDSYNARLELVKKLFKVTYPKGVVEDFKPLAEKLIKMGKTRNDIAHGVYQFFGHGRINRSSSNPTRTNSGTITTEEILAEAYNVSKLRDEFGGFLDSMSAADRIQEHYPEVLAALNPEILSALKSTD